LDGYLKDKAAVFIDLGYFSNVLRKEFGSPRVDFFKFSEKICGDCERFRTYVYDCPPFQNPIPTPEQSERTANFRRFVYTLNRLPRFEVRLGRLAHRGEYDDGSPRFEQKGTDVLLSIDITKLSWNRTIQKAIIVTGDSDFFPAVKSAKEAGVIVEIYYSLYEHASDELLEECDDRFPIDKDMIDSCGMD